MKIYPYSIAISDFTSIEDLKIVVTGKLFLNLRALYVSASDVSMFSYVSAYNPFQNGSQIQKTSYPEFSGVKIMEFSVIGENGIVFNLPEIPQVSGKIDIIAENEAGYGKLTNTRLPFLSTWEGAEDYQFPHVDGIKITLI